MFCVPRIQQLALLALLQYFFLSANAVPLAPRQAGPTSVMTVQTLNTVAGQMTQTCVVTLTPITDNNGQPAVQEVRSCTINAGANANNGAQQSPPPAATVDSNSPPTISVGTTTFSTDSSGTSQFTSSASLATTAIDQTTNPAAATTSVLSTPPAGLPGSPTSNAQVVVNGLSTVPASAAATSPPSVTNPSAAADSAQTQATSGATSASVSGSAAAANASTSAAAAFQLPGRQLSVLPIGLGVFAGISVIALIVVGLVTYERTKYRKAFRQRKLAETGATMGYGGMAQR